MFLRFTPLAVVRASQDPRAVQEGRRTRSGRRDADRARMRARFRLEGPEDRCLLSGISSITEFPLPSGSSLSGVLGAITTGPDGNLWFLDPGTNSIGVATLTTSQLVATQQPPASVTAGSAFGITVTAEVSSGSPITSFDGTVTVGLATNPGGATLGGTLSATAVDGVATFSGLSLATAAAGYTFDVTASGLGEGVTSAHQRDTRGSQPVGDPDRAVGDRDGREGVDHPAQRGCEPMKIHGKLRGAFRTLTNSGTQLVPLQSITGDKEMKTRRAASPFRGDEAGPEGHSNGDDLASPRERRHLRLSPIAAIAIAAAGLALAIGLENDRFGFRLSSPPACSPAEAVDISLQRVIRVRLSQRLQRERRRNASPDTNRATLDDALVRIREHPVYVMIKERMTDHLRNQGYDRVPLRQPHDPTAPVLSLDAEAALETFMYSLQAFFPAPNEKIVTFLNDHEEIFGKSIASRGGADRCDVTVPLLIQLLAEDPDGLELVAAAVEIIPRPGEDIERALRGDPPQ